MLYANVVMWSHGFIADDGEVPGGEVLGVGVDRGHAVDDGGEDGAVEELHHGDHLEEGRVQEDHQHHRGEGVPGRGEEGPVTGAGVQRLYRHLVWVILATKWSKIPPGEQLINWIFFGVKDSPPAVRNVAISL